MKLKKLQIKKYKNLIEIFKEPFRLEKWRVFIVVVVA